MKLLGMLSAALDSPNPVMIKEFRQAVRSRLVIAVLILFLLVNLAVMGGYLLLSVDAPTSIDGGRTVFMILHGILLATCVFFVPLYTGARLSLERNDANIDLLFISTITPAAIVRGKYLAAMALTLLIFSSCMPFIVFTYLLRGIDLPTIFFILGIAFLVCTGANAAGVFAGCIPGSWMARGLAALGMLFVVFYSTVGMISWISFYFIRGFGPMVGVEFWAGIGTVVLIEFIGIGLLHVLSIALISPKASNRMFIPRVYITGAWAVIGITVAVWSCHDKSLIPIYLWVGGSVIFLSCLAMLALGERDTWSPRVRRKIPNNRFLRLCAFLLYTGSAGGVAWCASIVVATILLGLLWGRWGASLWPGGWRSDFIETHANTAIWFAYVLCYCLTAAFLRLFLLKNVRTVYLPFVALFLGIALCLGPYLIGFYVTNLNVWSLESSPYLLGSPMILSVVDSRAVPGSVAAFVSVWLLLCLILSARWFVGQWQRFVPLETGARDVGGMENVDHAPRNHEALIANPEV